MDSGIFWEAKAHGSSHAISWHDVVVPELGNYRVWVHAVGSGLLHEFVDSSKSQVDARIQFKIAGIEIEAYGDKFLPVSSDEKLARLKIASLKKDAPSQGFRASLFRELPYSKIEVEHLKCLRVCRMKIEEEYRKPLRLSAVDSVSTIIFKGGKSGSQLEQAFRNNLEIASTKVDSIAIAKIYSELSKAGSSNIVKQICVDLDVDSQIIYSALRVARTQGWLTASGKGKSGGVLTKEGDKAFKDLRGEIKLNSWLSRGSGTVK
jgi:hypothetical protein